MALSGFIGAGVQDALSQQLAEQLRQAMFEEEQRQAKAREEIARGEQQSRERDREERARLTQELRDMQKGEAEREAAKAAYDQTANANMSELVNDPVQLKAFGVASGQIKPIDLLNLENKATAKKYTNPLKVVGPDGKPVYQQFEEGNIPEGTKVWDEPPAAGSGKPRTDIRSVQARGPNGEPGTKTMVFQDGALVEEHWTPGNPSASERAAFGDFETVKEAFQLAREAFDPKLVGPVQGTLGSIQQRMPFNLPFAPDNEKFTELKARVAAIQNQLLYLRSGKAISEPEFRRMMRELPGENDRDENFLIKLNTAERLLTEYIANRKTAAGVSGPGGEPAAGPQRKPIPGIPGAEAELRDGRWIRVK